MISDKKRMNRDAKGQIMIMLSAIPEEKKKELIEKYKRENQDEIMTENARKVLVGNWFNNAVKMLLKGATEDELNQVLEHVVVLLGCTYYNLDVQKSHKDHDLLNLTRKYFGGEKAEIKTKPVSEERRETLKKREAARYKLKLKIISMKDEGMNNTEIADELGFPESTIRSILEMK